MPSQTGPAGKNSTMGKQSNRTGEPKKIIAVKNGASRMATNNQLSGMNSNPIHVLSAGAGDLLANHTGSMSPTYQNISAFHGNHHSGAKMNPYFTSNSGITSDHARQKNS